MCHRVEIRWGVAVRVSKTAGDSNHHGNVNKSDFHNSGNLHFVLTSVCRMTLVCRIILGKAFSEGALKSYPAVDEKQLVLDNS